MSIEHKGCSISNTHPVNPPLLISKGKTLDYVVAVTFHTEYEGGYARSDNDHVTKNYFTKFSKQWGSVEAPSSS